MRILLDVWREDAMRRAPLWALLIIGVARIAVPLVLRMPGRARAGGTMMENFEPIMAPDAVATTASYY